MGTILKKQARCLGCALALGAASLLSAGALGAAQEPALPEKPPEPPPVSYAEATDRELTELAARWNDLSAGQRRALLSEMKLRMARQGTTNDGLRVVVTRRYGTLVRRPNGATLRIELRSVQNAQPGFGAGFERRIGRDGEPSETPETAAPPVVKVADQD